MTKRILILSVVLLMLADHAGAQSNEEMKKKELKELGEKLVEAKTRVKKTWNFRAGDLLQLLPTVSVGRRSPYEMMSTAETYVSLSISTNQIWDMSDRYDKRDALRTKALRQIETNGFIIRKYIDRKYLLKDRLWKFTQIKKSIDNPVDITTLDEKMDELKVKIQEVEIGIEKAFAEIEYLCVDVEK